MFSAGKLHSLTAVSGLNGVMPHICTQFLQQQEVKQLVIDNENFFWLGHIFAFGSGRFTYWSDPFSAVSRLETPELT
jgi:hypothetical protein